MAVAAAKRAFHRNSEWRQLDASQRGVLINKFGDLVKRDSKYLAELETYNNGMVCTFLDRFIDAMIKNIRYIAACADKIHGDTIPAGKDINSNYYY